MHANIKYYKQWVPFLLVAVVLLFHKQHGLLWSSRDSWHLILVIKVKLGEVYLIPSSCGTCITSQKAEH